MVCKKINIGVTLKMGIFLYKFGVNEVAKRGFQKKTGYVYVWKKRGGQQKLKITIYQINSENLWIFFSSF